jgi:hypothetical protein
LEVSHEPGSLTKVVKDGRNVLNVLFDWRHKDSCIIRIEGRSHDRSSTSNLVKEVVLSSQLKNFLQGVNRKHKEKLPDSILF